MYSLRKVDGHSKNMGAGDQGSMSRAFRFKEKGVVDYEGREPRVGWQMLVGTTGTRSFSNQDWWQTSPVKRILRDTTTTKDRKRGVRFETESGSIYEWTEYL